MKTKKQIKQRIENFENLIKNGNHYPSNLSWEYDITIKILKWVLDEKTEEEQQDIAYKALMKGKAHL